MTTTEARAREKISEPLNMLLDWPDVGWLDGSA
jgi:hypothetical protein